jgi:hypothetical protein
MKENIKRQKSGNVLLNRVIPARIVIGVTGERKLDIQPWLVEEIHQAIESIIEHVPKLSITPLVLTILSPLAEGADRLVARELLKLPNAALDVILPFEKKDYEQDFTGDRSRVEFNELLSQASSIKTIQHKKSRNEAYEEAGEYIVNQCDVLIAIWDGKPSGKLGGTEKVVQYARKARCPLIVIGPEKAGKVYYEMGDNLCQRSFLNLERYNSENVDSVLLRKKMVQNQEIFSRIADITRFPFSLVEQTSDFVLYHYVRADLLAILYQKRHNRTDTMVYILALIAVIIAAFQIFYVPEYPTILIAEVVLMLGVLAVVAVSRKQEWHNRWIDYRFLSERFRSAIFMALAGVEITARKPQRHLNSSYSSNEWMIEAFLEVWNGRPKHKNTDSTLFCCLRGFVCESWMQDQINHHEQAEKRHYRRHHFMTNTTYVLFGLTICVAILHMVLHMRDWENTLAFAAIVFPAIAASIAAYRTHHDYLRNSIRSGEMKRILEEIKDRILTTEDYNNFVELLKEVEETMLYENQDWKTVVRFQSPEVPV